MWLSVGADGLKQVRAYVFDIQDATAERMEVDERSEYEKFLIYPWRISLNVNGQAYRYIDDVSSENIEAVYSALRKSALSLDAYLLTVCGAVVCKTEAYDPARGEDKMWYELHKTDGFGLWCKEIFFKQAKEDWDLWQLHDALNANPCDVIRRLS